MFVDRLAGLQQSGNMLAYFDYYICQILFVLLVVQGHKHFFNNLLEVFLIGLYLIAERKGLPKCRICHQILLYFLCSAEPVARLEIV